MELKNVQILSIGEIKEITAQIEQEQADEPAAPEISGDAIAAPVPAAAPIPQTPQANDINNLFKLQLAK